MKEVTIVCDGSSLGNGKGNPRAAAVAVLGYRGYWRAFASASSVHITSAGFADE